MSTPLVNPEAEACAVSMAAELPDKVKAIAHFHKYHAGHPNLKNWEAHAIGNRAMELLKERTETKDAQ